MHWNQPENGKHVVMDFSVQLDHIYGSALEKALCELGMCQPSFKRTVLSGKECNHCQTLHKTFAMEIEMICTNDVPKEIKSLEFVQKYLTGYQSVNCISWQIF